LRATEKNSCKTGSSADTSICQCNAGYYGNGEQCSACTTCSVDATLKNPCLSDSGSTTDSVQCICNAGYYGDGKSCSGKRLVLHVDRDCLHFSSKIFTACRTCHQFAAKQNECTAGSAVDVSSCVCNQGYQGDGETSCHCIQGSFFDGKICHSCRQCSPDSTRTNDCPVGSKVDTVVCTCNAGYFGNGVVCKACTSCHSDATIANECAPGSSSDSVKCMCNSGFFGDGLTCR
jgi:hypothetical protein